MCIIIILSLATQIALASDKCNCPTGSTSAIKYYVLGKSITFPGNAYVKISSANNLSQKQHNNYAINSSSPNLTSLHPIMHPTLEQMNKWMGMYKAAPKANLSLKVGSILSMFSGAHFSLLNYLDYTPSERNQGNCGNCWAWAGTGVMEIDHAYQTGIMDRLSVQYLDSNYLDSQKNCLACCGGWLDDVSSFYSITKKVIPWSNTNAKWQDGNTNCQKAATNVPASSISTDPHYNIDSISAVTIPTQGVGKETAIANIKNVLGQGKAIWFGFFLPDDNAWNNFFSFWDRQQESVVWKPDFASGRAYNINQGGGHAVLCVGYNDTNPQNRYWIMLNSWGASSNRPNGLFLVNMDMNYDCSYAGLGAAFYWMTLNIKYANAPPSVPSTPEGPSTGNKGSPYAYSTLADDSSSRLVKYTFSWGDGTNSTTKLVDSGTEASASHIWSKTGTYQVKATATDDSGVSSGWSSPLTVTIASISPPDVPIKPFGPSSGYKKVEYKYSTYAKDIDGDLVKYTFDWGDGTLSTTNLVNSGTNAGASHTWSTSGTYYVRTNATDSNGASSEWSNPLTVTIAANTPPNQPNMPIGPGLGGKQVPYKYIANSKDIDGDLVKYTFDWGDGTSTVTGLVSSGKTVISSHIWRSAGTYNVKIMATDSRDASSGWSNFKVVRIL